MTADPLLARAREASARLLTAGRRPVSVDAVHDALLRSGLATTAVGGSRLSPERNPRLPDVAAFLRTRHPDRVRDGIHALDLASDPLHQALALVALGAADAVVTTPDTTLGELVAAADWVAEPADGGDTRPLVYWIRRPDGAFRAVADCLARGPLTPGLRAWLAAQASAAWAGAGMGAARVVFLAGPPDAGDEPAARAAAEAFAEHGSGAPARVEPEPRFREDGNVFIFPGRTAAFLTIRTARDAGGMLLLGPQLLGGPGVCMSVAEDATHDELVATAALARLAADGAGT